MGIELKIQPLRYVLAVWEEGSFHGVARQLHRSQPALSMAIRDLEERVILQRLTGVTSAP